LDEAARSGKPRCRSAFEFSRYGAVPGTLDNVPATTFVTQDGSAFYKTKVKLGRSYVGDDPARNLILPGMTVQADIITGSRTVLQYLLKPIHLSRLTAFHER
jgi:HlyD family secretion protein/adhesin transport system membrane fusion protein